MASLFPNRYYIVTTYPASIFGISTDDPDRNWTPIWRVDGNKRAELVAIAVANRFGGDEHEGFEFSCTSASEWSDRDQLQTEQCLDERLEQMNSGTDDPDWPIYEVTRYAIDCERALPEPEDEKPRRLLAEPSPGPHAADDLLRYLADLPDEMAPVIELPEGFRDPDMLTVCDADGLIEFGTRNHCVVGDHELCVEKGWGFSSVTGPNRKPMKLFISETLNFTGDERIRLHVRLTAKGRIRAARLTVNRPAAEPELKPAAMDMREVRRRVLEICDAGQTYTSVRDLMKRVGCGSTSTVSNAINGSQTLKDWRDRSLRRKRKLRASGLTDFVTDNTAHTAVNDPSDVLPNDDIDIVMRRLIEEAEPEERARLNEMNKDEKRELVKVYYEQHRDLEPSPLEDDATGRKPRKVVQHKTV